MQYTKGWIEKNVGVSKATLDLYEKKKLVVPNRNPNNGYCEYSESDLKKIWKYKMLIRMEFSHEQIESIFMGKTQDLRTVFLQQIKFYEREQRRYENLKRVAHYMLGTDPDHEIPDQLGGSKFEEFIMESFDNWSSLGYKSMLSTCPECGERMEKDGIYYICWNCGQMKYREDNSIENDIYHKELPEPCNKCYESYLLPGCQNECHLGTKNRK